MSRYFSSKYPTIESNVLAALNPHRRIGPPMAAYSRGEITPSVVFSDTVSTVALMISSSLKSCVSRPTIRATCVRPAATPCPSAFSTPRASFAILVMAMPIQSSRAMAISRGMRPSSPQSIKISATTATVSSTVEAVRNTALFRRLPPRRRSFFSTQPMYLPMMHTG